jgi:phage recombination protein Bet
MSTAAKPKTEVTAKPQPQENQAIIYAPRLPYHPAIEQRFGIDKTAWKPLVEAIFPNATTTDAVILALSYCKARRLDPFKRCVHIVPIWNKQLGCMVDTIWPGIGELRTTAFRTGEYAGRSNTEFGPDIARTVGSKEMTYPEWAQVTVYRIIKGQRVEFCGPRVYWDETYATQKRNDDTPNEMWADRPRGQIDKCAEAAALRAAFPEEVGSDMIPEEIERNAFGSVLDAKKIPGKPVTSLDDINGSFIEHKKPEPKPGPNAEPHDEANQGELPDDTNQEIDYRPEFLDAAGQGFLDCENNEQVGQWFEKQTGLAESDEERTQLTTMATNARARIKKGGGK